MRWKPLFDKAKTALVVQHPFFAQVFLQLKVVETDEVPFAATDGYSLMVNPKAIEAEEWTVNELVGVLAHECMHILGMHHIRRESRDHTKWNIATDLVINSILVKNGFTLPSSALLSDKYDSSMSPEEIYNLLPKNPPSPNGEGGNDGNDSENSAAGAQMGGVLDAPENGKSRTEEEMRVKEIGMRAAATAKMAGNMPGFAGEWLREMFEPTISWQDQLRRYMTERIRDDYSWLRGNRRFVNRGLYLPSLDTQNRMGEVVIALDTSGSVSNEELSSFYGELAGIIRDTRPTKVTVLHFTTEIEEREEFIEPDEFSLDPQKRYWGGTDVRSVFEYLEAHGETPRVLVVFSDMETPFPEYSHIDTLWVASRYCSSTTPPFGNYVKIEGE